LWTACPSKVSGVSATTFSKSTLHRRDYHRSISCPIFGTKISRE
jgi:hypothetical protein